MSTTCAQTIMVDTPVPFGPVLNGWLVSSSAGGRLETLIAQATPFERAFLAWETVRKGGNPFLEKGTGFEGYFVGCCISAEQALTGILEVGQDILGSILRLHPFDPRLRSNLFRTLAGEASDLKAMVEWSAQLGAALARLRATTTNNPQAEQFRSATYRNVSLLPPIQYCQSEHSLRQHYIVQPTCSYEVARARVSAADVPASQREAWLVIDCIGKFGHPLLRAYMREH